MSAKRRKILDPTQATVKINEFREALQDGFENCDAKAFTEYISQDVNDRFKFFFSSSIAFVFRLMDDHHESFLRNI